MAFILVASLAFLVAAASPDPTTLLLYGQLVDGAYKLKGGAAAIGDYHITKNLFVTETTGQFFGEPHVQAGFVAISNSNKDITVVLRGTSSLGEWIKDLLIFPVPFPYLNGSSSNSPNVHAGFLSLYTAPSIGNSSLRDRIVLELKTLVSENPGYSISFAGHSLGGALAILAAFDVYNSVTFNSGNELQLDVYTFGAPMVGDESFRQAVNNNQKLSVLRVSDVRDLFPYLPSLGYVHVGEEIQVDGCALDNAENETDDAYSVLAMYHKMDRYLRTLGTFSKLQSSGFRYVLRAKSIKNLRDLVTALIGSVSSGVKDTKNLVTSSTNFIVNVSATCQN